MMTSTPHKDEGGHLFTAYGDWTTYHRGGHRHSIAGWHGWEGVSRHWEPQQRSQEARPDPQRKAVQSMWSQKDRNTSSHKRPCAALGLWPVGLIITSLG